MTPKEKAQKWLGSNNIDDETRTEIKNMLHDPDQSTLVDCFYKDLEFGTGGLRGIMGVGSNRMNKYTVGMATQGLSNYLLKSFPDEQIKVALAHDSRNQSDFFTDVAASVFSANGIHVYKFKELRPTPELSFAIRELRCQSGVVITASHNPREYNGYKAYWNDGAQVTPPHDSNIIEEVSKIVSIDEVKFVKDPSKVEVIGDDLDEKYLQKVMSLCLSPEAISQHQDLRIVYSPLHGTGGTLVPSALKNLGFNQITIIEEQAIPDGNFPTVVYPNPEESEALTLSLQKAEEINADLVMATDPDADRVGIAVRNTEGNFQLLNGNQTAALLLHYTLTRRKELGLLQDKHYVVKTIVTSEIVDAIASHNGVECFNTLTGFKYIATIIRELEGNREFLAGGEESYGYMFGEFVRDKDAVSSCAVIAEMTAFARSNGLSVFQMLLEVYRTHGFYLERLHSMTRRGKAGAEEIEEMMRSLRADPPTSINGETVTEILDYNSLIKKEVATGQELPLAFPKSNVLQFYTDKGSKISARPSGTEPKIKFYISVKSALPDPSLYRSVEKTLNKRMDEIIEDLNLN